MQALVVIDIDLEKGSISEKRVDFRELSLFEKLGGFGRAVYYFKQYLDSNPQLIHSADPGFHPDNPVSIDLGIFSGSNISTALRTVITSLSPLKTSIKGGSGIFYSAASGDFGRLLRSHGIDSIRLLKRSLSPSLIHVGTGKTAILAADFLSSKTTLEKIRILSGIYPQAAFAVIGPAGERQFRNASVAFSTTDQIEKGSDNMRFAGRGGMGGVLGNKNVLALVVEKGEGQFRLDDITDINKYIASNPKSMKYRIDGTFQGNIVSAEELRVGVHNNFSKTAAPATSDLFGKNLAMRGYAVGNKGCFGCVLKCWKEISAPDKKILGKIDYETGTLLGPNLGIYDIESIMELIRFADSQGLDAISLGGALGCRMEQDDHFGDMDYARSVCKGIQDGTDEGFGQGIARTLGYFNPAAMHVKGIEFPAYPGFANPGYAFAIAGLHMSMDTYNKAWQIDAKNSLEEWTQNILLGPRIILYDMIGVCKFSKLTFEQVVGIYNKTTSENVTVSGIKDAALTVYHEAREIDRRMGFTEEDDLLPGRCFNEYDTSVPHFLTEDFFSELKQRVYAGFKEERARLGL